MLRIGENAISGQEGDLGMAQLKVTADNMLVELLSDKPAHLAALKQGYDGGWSISSDPEPLSADLPDATFPTREELVEAIRAAGHAVVVEPASREGAGH